jgi:hypothetical protein
MTTSNKPVQNLRLGALQAAVWANQHEGRTYYNVTFTRSYKDGDEWKESDSFGRDDLLALSKLADQAHTWIHEHQQAQSRENQQQPADDGQQAEQPWTEKAAASSGKGRKRG